MARLVTIQQHPHGPRCWVAGVRIHHGATGCALAALAGSRRHFGVALLALGLAAHDRADWREWFKVRHLTSPLDKRGPAV